MNKLKTKSLPVDGDDYVICEMFGMLRFKIADIEDGDSSKAEMGELLLNNCVVKPADFDMNRTSAHTCEILVNEIMELSELGDDAMDAAEKKSEELPSADTGTG